MLSAREQEMDLSSRTIMKSSKCHSPLLSVRLGRQELNTTKTDLAAHSLGEAAGTLDLYFLCRDVCPMAIIDELRIIVRVVGINKLGDDVAVNPMVPPGQNAPSQSAWALTWLERYYQSV